MNDVLNAEKIVRALLDHKEGHPCFFEKQG